MPTPRPVGHAQATSLLPVLSNYRLGQVHVVARESARGVERIDDLAESRYLYAVFELVARMRVQHLSHVGREFLGTPHASKAVTEYESSGRSSPSRKERPGPARAANVGEGQIHPLGASWWNDVRRVTREQESS